MVELTWYTAMATSIAYVIAALVVATRLHKADTPAATQPTAFAAIWSMILLVLLLVGGTVVLKRIQTPIATGACVRASVPCGAVDWVNRSIPAAPGWPCIHSPFPSTPAYRTNHSLDRFGPTPHSLIYSSPPSHAPPPPPPQRPTHRRLPGLRGHVQPDRARPLHYFPGPLPAGGKRGGGQRLRGHRHLLLLPLRHFWRVHHLPRPLVRGVLMLMPYLDLDRARG